MLSDGEAVRKMRLRVVQLAPKMSRMKAAKI